MNKKNKALIIEPHFTGHHGPWVEWISNGFTEAGFAVTVQTFKQSLPHQIIGRLRDMNVALLEMPLDAAISEASAKTGTPSLIRRDFWYWRLFRSWYNYVQEGERGAHIVFLPYLDYCLYAIGLLGSPFGDAAWAGLAMRPAFHYSKVGVLAPSPRLRRVKEFLFFRALANRHLWAFFTIDESLDAYLKASSRLRTDAKIHLVPQPADLGVLPEQSVARDKLSLPQGRKLILVYGALAVRKGIVELVRAIRNPTFPGNADILLAGQQADDLKSFLSSGFVCELVSAGRLIVRNQFIRTEIEALYFAAADAVWLGYDGFYNASGVLVQAARAGRPAIGCRQGLIGWQVQKYQCGLVVDAHNEGEIVRVLTTLLTDKTLAQRLGDNGRKAFAANTTEKAVRCLAQPFVLPSR